MSKNKVTEEEVKELNKEMEKADLPKAKPKNKPYKVRDGHIKKGGSYTMINGKAVLNEEPK